MLKVITFAIGSLSTGGIGRNTINLSKYFISNGFEVDILLTTHEKEIRSELVPIGVNIVNLGNRSRYAIFNTVKYIKSRRPDLIISAHHHIDALVIIARGISGLKNRIIIFCTFRTHRTSQLKSSTFQGILYDKIAFMLYRFADLLIANSYSVAQDIEHSKNYRPNTIKVVHNPAWSNKFLDLSNSKAPITMFNNNSLPFIISAGRLTPEKDYQTLLYGFNMLRNKMDVNLLILGAGEEKQEIENTISKLRLEGRVILMGFVTNPFPYFRQASLFVHAVRWEGFGNVLVEALGIGLPIVASVAPGGIKEVLSNGKYGELVPVGDDKQLAIAMEKMLSSPPTVEYQQKGAKEFTIEKSAERLIKLYNQVSGVIASSVV
jgi:glycosyltransferase involved in cell wall biosynthesis